MLIVGAGRIGRETARLVEAFGAAPSSPAATPTSTRCSPQADIVSVHAPLTPETRHLIDARRLALMRPTAVLINTARGPVVDEAALGGGAARRDDRGRRARRLRARARGTEALLALENVVLAPHLGSATRDTRVAMGMLCVSALRAVLLEGRTPANVVP